MTKNLLKVNFILLSILLLSFSKGFSQDARTRLQFEDAEKAFNAGNYKGALEQLDAVEQQVGVTSKTLYLRIVAENELFDHGARIFEDKEQLERLLRIRKNADSYLKALSKQEVDDKYRRVYEISESLQQFPKSEQEWRQTVSAMNEKQRRLEEKIKREKEKAANDLYTKVIQDRTETAAASYLKKYPKGEHIKEVEKIYADALYREGVAYLKKDQYAAAQRYFNTYTSKFPSGDKIAAINHDKAALDRGLKQQAMLTKWDNLDCYVMLSYTTDGNFGFELGGMDVSQRVNVFVSAEGKKPFDVIFGTPEDDPIATSGVLEDIVKEYFEEINFTGTFGANIRITYPLWVYAAAGVRFDRLMAKQDMDPIDKGDTFKAKDKKNTTFFPEVGAGVRVGGHLILKSGVRLVHSDPVVKVGLGIAF